MFDSIMSRNFHRGSGTKDIMIYGMIQLLKKYEATQLYQKIFDESKDFLTCTYEMLEIVFGTVIEDELNWSRLSAVFGLFELYLKRSRRSNHEVVALKERFVQTVNERYYNWMVDHICELDDYEFREFVEEYGVKNSNLKWMYCIGMGLILCSFVFLFELQKRNL